jgi:hypothetical protein
MSWLNFGVSSTKRVSGPCLGHKELEPLSLTLQIGEPTWILRFRHNSSLGYKLGFRVLK